MRRIIQLQKFYRVNRQKLDLFLTKLWYENTSNTIAEMEWLFESEDKKRYDVVVNFFGANASRRAEELYTFIKRMNEDEGQV